MFAHRSARGFLRSPSLVSVLSFRASLTRVCCLELLFRELPCYSFLFGAFASQIVAFREFVVFRVSLLRALFSEMFSAELSLAIACSLRHSRPDACLRGDEVYPFLWDVIEAEPRGGGYGDGGGGYGDEGGGTEISVPPPQGVRRSPYPLRTPSVVLFCIS